MDSAAWLARRRDRDVQPVRLRTEHASVLGATSPRWSPWHCTPMIGHGRYLYRGRHQFGTFDEVRTVTTTVLATAVVW
jgi:hypothetical protein